MENTSCFYVRCFHGMLIKYMSFLFSMNYLFQILKFCSFCVYLLIKNSTVAQVSFLDLIFAVCVESIS